MDKNMGELLMGLEPGEKRFRLKILIRNKILMRK